MSFAPFAKLSTDAALGAAGCGLATVSAAFGLYMVVHGPPAGSLGTSKDFTVFAQLAPRARRAEPPSVAKAEDNLDLEATASIPRGNRPPVESRPGVPGIVASMAVERVDGEEATIDVHGRALVVRVGDIVPGAGEVLAITPGARPEIVTSSGRIVMRAE